MSAEALTYLDSSAIVKLIVEEVESDALIDFLRTRPVRASSALARVEVVQAVRAHGDPAIQRARGLLRGLRLLSLDQVLLDAAADLDSPGLRSLDTIHIASALTLGSELGELVTYDARMARAAEQLQLVVVAPGTG